MWLVQNYAWPITVEIRLNAGKTNLTFYAGLSRSVRRTFFAEENGGTRKLEIRQGGFCPFGWSHERCIYEKSKAPLWKRENLFLHRRSGCVGKSLQDSEYFWKRQNPRIQNERNVRKTTTYIRLGGCSLQNDETKIRRYLHRYFWWGYFLFVYLFFIKLQFIKFEKWT